MQIISLAEELKKSTYPGRGIVVGKSCDGKNAVTAYFIMGRSQNSRNRIFVATKDGIRTQAFDPLKMTDPSLVIYSPVRVFEDVLIVTNGDQTDTIFEGLKNGKSIYSALGQRKFEPDEPNFTPRISATLDISGKKCHTNISILKAQDSEGKNCCRFFFDYEDMKAGEGYFIHTYQGDGNPLPCFSGEPEKVLIQGDEKEFCSSVWESLDEENKVSLFVRFIDLSTRETKDLIVNKNK